MNRTWIAAAALAALPMTTQAQSLQYPGFYIGAEGGLNWLLNTSSTSNVFAGGLAGSFNSNLNTNLGWTAGGMIGYDFVGPRVELESRFIQNTGTLSVPGANVSAGATVNQVPIMANLYYDFMAGGPFVPYIGAGAGIAFSNVSVNGNSTYGGAQFAYQGMIGVGWNIDSNFRLNLEGRYFGTTQPSYNFNVGGAIVSGNYTNNNFSAMLSLQYKFGAPAVAPPPPTPMPAATSFMVFFDWDRSNLQPAGAGDDRAGRPCLQGQGQCAHHRDRPHRHVGPGELQHGAVAASCQCGQGRAGAKRRAGHGNRGRRPRRAGPAGPDAGRCPRAAEPPRRDRAPVRL